MIMVQESQTLRYPHVIFTEVVVEQRDRWSTTMPLSDLIGGY